MSSIAALLPGAKITNSGKVALNPGGLPETVVFNIGGVKFETYRSTLQKRQDLPLANDNFLRKNFRKETGDYFFDRDPDIFKAILNFLRTDEFHLPSFVCGPAAKHELEFWGIPDDVIERCCWTDYNSWNATLAALNQLERDRQGSYLRTESAKDRNGCIGLWSLKVWKFLNNPNSSLAAKIYGYVCLICVVASIFSFMAETHPSFHYDTTVQTIRGHNSTPNTPSHTTINQLSNASSIDEGYIDENKTHSNGTQYIITRVKMVNPVLRIIDLVCLCFFTADFISRVVFARKRLRYITSLTGLFDLLALLPDYIELLAYTIKPELQDGSVDFIAILRIARVLRIFRLIRHFPGLWILLYTLKASLKELLLMSAFLLVGMLVFASLIYFVEDHDDFTSIPHGFWWALITMTTVGYGDMYPKTNWGYLIGSFCALSGLLMIGFSVPVLVSNFIMYYKHVQFAIEEETIKEKRLLKEKEKEKDGGLFEMMKNHHKNNNTTESEPLNGQYTNTNATTSLESA